MREIGKIINYNGFSGIIKSEKGIKYVILKKDIMNKETLSINDDVTFIPDIYKSLECTERIARFIKKVNK